MRDFEGKLLAGVRRRMSLADDRTSELWREFRTRESDIPNRLGGESYNAKGYDPEYTFSSFDPSAEFDKWAAAAIAEPTSEFEMLEIPAGQYAVFIHKGPAAEAPRTFGYIFGQWLPKSGYELDSRPHFEILPEGYSPFDAEAEEEIWIPVKEKQSR